VAVWDADGRLLGLVVGDELGARRTGALGAVAVDALARPEADIVGVIGTDRQAWTQLWALTAVRDLTQVRVHSPNEQRRRTFAVRAHDELGLVVTPTVDAASAIRNAGIVVLARTSHRTLPGEISRGAARHLSGRAPRGAVSSPSPSQHPAASRAHRLLLADHCARPKLSRAFGSDQGAPWPSSCSALRFGRGAGHTAGRGHLSYIAVKSAQAPTSKPVASLRTTEVAPWPAKCAGNSVAPARAAASSTARREVRAAPASRSKAQASSGRVICTGVCMRSPTKTAPSPVSSHTTEEPGVWPDASSSRRAGSMRCSPSQVSHGLRCQA